MKIGDRVAYDEENATLDDIHGTVAEPTDEELQGVRGGDPTVGPRYEDVMVAWDDGERFWEDPASLVVVGGADS